MGSIYRPKYKDKTTGEARESAIWWALYYVNGRRHRESTETTDYNEARDFVKKQEGQAASGLPVPRSARSVTFADLAALEVNDYEKNDRRSLEDLKGRFENHILPALGHMKANRIRPAEINSYVALRRAEGAANASINRELAAIRRAYALGIASELIHSAPRIEMLRENNARKGFFSRDQLDSILKRLRPHNIPPSIFAFITGWRKSEILSLKWAQVDFNAGIVRLEPGTTKNDEARVFPFTSELRALLEAQRAKADALKQRGVICPWVFFAEAGARRKGRRIGDFKHNWNSACEAAAIPGRIFHDFRRTAVRNLVRAGIPERVAMQMTGHKTRSVFERYNIVDEADLFEAARRLEEYQTWATVSQSHGQSRHF